MKTQTIAPQYDVVILAVACMPDHLHESIKAQSRYVLWRFMQQLLSMFAKEHNVTCHRKGALFKSPFGSAPKTSDKKIRTNLAYVANNPVERHLAKNAEEYRWTFLAYANSSHPFSKPISKKRASRELKEALALVDLYHSENKHLKYSVLQTMFAGLNKEESEQLTDYIISKYSVIDFHAAISYYGSYEKMLTALHSNTGSEYDIKETFNGKRDDVYSKMCSLLMGTGRFKDIHDVLGLKADEKLKLFNYLLGKTEASPKQIANYLQVEIKTA